MKKKILVLGASGMIGSAIFKVLSKFPEYDVYGTARKKEGLEQYFTPELFSKIRKNVDAENFDSIMRSLASIQPDVVINCIGIIKQKPLVQDPLITINHNALLPHRISMVCRAAKARMIQISTDCVFEGTKSNYTEEDIPDAHDIYGRTKYLGEVNHPHCITIRTSTIGPELKGKFGFMEWFLAEQNEVNGFAHAIFSGLPTNEFANVIGKYIIPNENLSGLYHISAEPISKYDLLKLIAEEFDKKIIINKNDSFYQDRSLNGEKFKKETSYAPADWKTLIKNLKTFYTESQPYFINKNFYKEIL